MSRKLLLLLLVPAVLLVGAYLFIRMKLSSGVDADKVEKVDTLGGKKASALDLRPLFIERIQQVLKQSSNDLYKLDIGDMQVDVLASSIMLSAVTLKADSVVLDSMKKKGGLPNDIYNIRFDSLEIQGINVDDAITSNTMDYDLIRLVRPVITIHHKKGKPVKEEATEEEFSQRFLKQMQQLSVKKLLVKNGEIVIWDRDANKASNKLKQVAIELNDVLLDSTTRTDKERFLFAKDGSLSFKDFVKPSKDGLYQMTIGETKIQSQKKQLTLSSFSFTSPLSKQQFSSRQKVSKELYNLNLSSVRVSNVDWWALLNEEEIMADNIDAQGGKLSIYLDRTLPPKNKMGNFPSHLVMKLPVKLNIDRFTLKDLDFTYEEYNPISQQSGSVRFGDVTISVNNISNVQMKPMTVNGTALFMNKVPVKADFVFDMKAYKSGKFSTDIKAPAFDATLVNSFTPAMGLMKIEKGTVNKLEASINGNQLNASGDVLIAYKDLKLALMEKDKGEKELDKKGFTSFVANLLVLKKDNDGSSPRRAKATFKRIPEGGFFMLVWKVVLVGILKTIGAPEKLAYKTVASSKKQ